MKIAILIGHGKGDSGGYDPGACSQGFQEFILAKEIGRYCAESLKQYDCVAELVNYDGTLNLPERITFCNSRDYDLIIECHLNSSNTPGYGCEVYYSKGDLLGNKMAAAISRETSDGLKIRNRGACLKLTSGGSDYFGIIRETKATALLVETCFINSSDVFTVSDQKGQCKAGHALAKAIAETCELKCKNEIAETKPKFKVELYPLSQEDAKKLAIAMQQFSEVLPGLYTTPKPMDSRPNQWKTQTAPIGTMERAKEIAKALRILSANRTGVTANAYIVVEK